MTAPLLPDFNDGKAPGALRTIGEVAKAFNLRQHVLRYWEEQFPMLRPLTRAGGRRYYRPEDVALVAEISRLLYQEGFTIRGARQALSQEKPGRASKQQLESTSGPPPVGGEAVTSADQKVVSPLGVVAELQALRQQLNRALEI